MPPWTYRGNVTGSQPGHPFESGKAAQLKEQENRRAEPCNGPGKAGHSGLNKFAG